MSVTISTVNVGVTANDGSGDDIRDAFIKVNYSLSNLKTGIDTVSTGGANTTLAKVANLQVTNQVLGNLYLTGSDTVYINGSPVTTAGNAFTGGNVAGAVAFQNATASNGSAYGAVTITGGLGVGQNIYVAGVGVYTGNLVAASITDASSTTAAALISRGGLGVAKSAYIGQNFNVAGTTSLSSTLGVTGVTSITNSTASTNSSTGALLVSGGVGAAGNINAGGTQHTLSGNLTVTGNLAVNGNLTFGTDTLRISDNIIDLHTDSANNPLTIDDGKDVGIRFHVYKPGYGDYAAFAGWANDSLSFEYYDRGVESGGSFVGTTYGVFKGGEFLSVNTTAATSTTTGAIRTSGGIAAAGNIYAGGNLVVTANISAGNVSATKGTFTSIAGTLLTAAQTNITSLGTLSAVTVSGTATLGNVITTNGLFWSNGVAFSASSTYSNTNVAAYLTGTVTVGNLITTNGVFWSNGSTALGGAGGGYGNAQVAQYLPAYSGNISGNLTTAAQTNITSVGTLTSLAVGAVTSSGTIIASTVNAGTIGNSGATLTGTISTAAQTNITSVGTLTSLAVGAVTSSGTVIASTVNAGTIGNSGATLTGTLSTAAQTNITSVGTLSSLTVSGTTNSGTLTAATLNATSANITTLAVTTGISTANAVITGGSINNVTVGATTHTTGRFTTVTATTVNAGTIGNASATLTGILSTAAQTNITSVGTLTGLTVSGNIVPNANVSIDLGSSSAWFNNIYGVAIQAKYADLAEHYVPDTLYKPGTVVVFGGSAEITLTTEFADVSVAGVISTDPAYLMNAANPGQPVALRGRVPVHVIGPVRKGDLLVTSNSPGYATSVGKNANYGVAVFAKALQDKHDDDVGTIEAVII